MNRKQILGFLESESIDCRNTGDKHADSYQHGAADVLILLTKNNPKLNVDGIEDLIIESQLQKVIIKTLNEMNKKGE